MAFILIDAQISANPAPSKAELQTYLEDHALKVGSESTGGYQQIFYIYNDVKIFITKNQNNHTHPVISGRYMAWEEVIDGFPQIILYDVLNKTELQVTQTGTNLSPAIWKNQIVWVGLDNGLRQIFYFDGKQTKQLSFDNTSLRPAIRDNIIAYAQYTGNQENPWRVVSYDLDRAPNEDPYQIVNEGTEENAWPHFAKNELQTSL